MNHFIILPSPVGELRIVENGEAIVAVEYENRLPARRYDAEREETPLLKAAAGQLAAYFAGKRAGFDLPLQPRGTDFQTAVWNALRAIPYGETRSYKQIAEAVGRPKAARAVGMANNRNPIAIVVPCHRVIGADGSLTGYAGGLVHKQALLDAERKFISQKTVPF